MGYPTLPEALLRAVERTPNPRAQLYRTPSGWRSYSSSEMLRRIAGLATALERYGVQAGDRVLLYCPNRPEWHVADFAILGLGGVTVPVYFRESFERLAYIAQHCEATVAIVAGAERLAQLLRCRPDLPRLQHLVAIGVEPPLPAQVAAYDDLVGRADAADITAYKQRVAAVSASDLASIIYTSGTTGEPKGVMLTHENFVSNVQDALGPLQLRRNDLALSFLPLAHVYERMIDYGYLFSGVSIAYVEEFSQVLEAFRELRPTIAAAVPRLFEKVYAELMSTRERLHGRRRQLFEWALRVATDSVPWLVYGRQPVRARQLLSWFAADLLIYRAVRRRLGGRMRAFISGGAPLARELAEFFWTIGVPVYQGYGLTETSPAVSANTPSHNKVGTVGRPIAHIEVRIAEDGEILVRGPCVMRGYYKDPEATATALTPEGWLRTGDLGYLDEDGFLVITDRKKELIKTAGGKLVAPQPIENRLRTSPFIANACVVGDRQRFIAALVVPNFAAALEKARASGIVWSSAEEAVEHPWLQQLIEAEVQRLTASLAPYERPKRVALLPKDFSFETGELTYTQKLKRRIVEEHYREVIERLYRESDATPAAAFESP